MSPKTRWFLFTMLAVVALDQATKLWIASNIELWRGHIEVIPGFFQLVHYQNKGAVGGIMGDSQYRIPIFIGFTVIALGAMVGMVRKLEAPERFVPFTLGLIAGGAVGNAIDRLWQGSVTDFLRFYTESPGVSSWLAQYKIPAEYPSFNVADMGITIGVVVFFLQQLIQDRYAKEEAIGVDELPAKTAD